MACKNFTDKINIQKVQTLGRLQFNYKRRNTLKLSSLKSALGTPSKNNKKKCNKCYIRYDPPPNVTKNTMYFLKETRPILGHFCKKNFFWPPERLKHLQKFSKLLKSVKNGQVLGYPPLFQPKFCFPKWLRIAWNGFKHNL